MVRLDIGVLMMLLLLIIIHQNNAGAPAWAAADYQNRPGVA